MPDVRRRRSSWSLIVIAAVLSTLCGGCAMTKRFKIDRIHQEAAARQTRAPVIFIHGFIGAKLRHRDTHETVWGRFVDAIKRGRTEELSLPIASPVMNENRDDLVPYDIYDKVAGVDFYAAILDTLTEAGGYTMGDINNPLPGDNCFVFYYDWRRDNVESALELGRSIRQIKNRLGEPDLRFDIVAHSMGGLIAEYYLRYGARDVLSDPGARPTYEGARDINRMVLIGTPRRGTMSALEALHTGISRSLDPQTLFTMPSIYQLLPNDAAVHFVDPRGRPIDVDLFDAGSWVRYGWSIFNRSKRSNEERRTVNGGEVMSLETRFLQSALDRAQSFHRALERDDGEVSPVPTHIFGSDCVPTLDRVILHETRSGYAILFDDEAGPGRSSRDLERLLFVPGDGTVTAGSLLALDDPDLQDPLRFSSRPVTSTYLFCETHGLLPTHRGFQDNLFHVLFHSPSRPVSAAHLSAGPVSLQ
jgi:pimeloyl-ACP methyl ester carboxylesterase